MNMDKPKLTGMKGGIFDLDGVIVDTAKYHYLAWRELADGLGFFFSEADNERLKGVSRMRSLEILLEVGGMAAKFTEEEKNAFADRKNKRYVEYISALREDEILSGAREYLTALRAAGVKTALGTASKNSMLILESLNITGLFDAIIDGNSTTRAKPDPEVFLLAAQAIGLSPAQCVVFEDAYAGIEAAKAAGMTAVGIGSREALPNADFNLSGLYALLEN